MTPATSYQRSLAVAALFTLAAGDFWRYLIGWWGWGALAVALVAAAVIELVRARIDIRRLPPTLLLFLAIAAASIIWSAYPGASALGVLATLATAVLALGVAAMLGWGELLGAFSTTVRWILGLSLLFEFVVAAFVRRPVLPLWVDYSDLEKIPAAFYWSRALLFEGGRIQGIVGNANLLGMIALLGLVVFVARLAAREGSPLWAWFWIAADLAVLVLTRSSTVTVAAIATALVAVFLLLVRRADGLRRTVTYLVGVTVGVVSVVLALVFREPLLGLLGRSPDLTNRLDIWQTVGELAAQRPVLGWGWVSYWIPWVEPFDDLVVIKGVTYLQAHNAWLDVFLQLGVIGLIVFSAFVLGAVVRSWGLAAQSTRIRFSSGGLRWPLAAAPVLLLVALLVQSLAESRLLVEIGFALLVIIAARTAWPESADEDTR